MELTGNTILITGGATGIGFALAARLAAHNTVIVCGRREAALRQAAQVIPSLVTHACDITNSDDRRALVAWLTVEYGKLGILINNAGIQRRIDFTAPLDESTVEMEIATNFLAPALLTSQLVPHLSRQANAMIVNVSSGLGFCPLADTPIYSATKAAVHSLSLSLRWQLRKIPIRVVELVPPLVATDLADESHPVRGARTNGPPVMSAAAFAEESIRRLEAGEDEIAVGMAENIRARRDTLFAMLNNRP